MDKNLNKNLNQTNRVNQNAQANQSAQNLPEGINRETLNKLLTIASKKLGCSPESLKNQLESGKFEEMLKNSDPKNPQMAKLKRAIGDPKAAEKMLNNPDTARIIKNLGNK